MLEAISCGNQGGLEARVIKRYSNRKLYDTKSSRYVTLLQIAQMVRAGEEVQIIDNRTKEDKTEVTLALIISEELKNSPGGIPLTTLKALIRHDSNPPPSGEQLTSLGNTLGATLGRTLASGALLGLGAPRPARVLTRSPRLEPSMDGLPSVEPTAEPVSADGASPEEEAPDALEERISGLPDSEKVLAFRGHVVRLSARVAELEQQLSRHKE